MAVLSLGVAVPLAQKAAQPAAGADRLGPIRCYERCANGTSTLFGHSRPVFGNASTLLSLILKSGLILLVFNEVRGVVLAVPILVGLYQSGGTLMAIWLAFCSLGGVVLSVIVPAYAVRKLSPAPA